MHAPDNAATQTPVGEAGAAVPEGSHPGVELKAWRNLDVYADLDELSRDAAEAHDLIVGAGKLGLEIHRGASTGTGWTTAPPAPRQR